MYNLKKLDFEVIFKENLPVIYIKDKDIKIKIVNQNDVQLSALIKEMYSKSPTAKTFVSKLNEQRGLLFSIGFYIEDELISTLSARKLEVRDFFARFKNENNEIINSFLNKLELRMSRVKNCNLVEVTRFASKENSIYTYFTLFIAYFYFILNTHFFKDKEYELISNSNNKHNNFYQRIYSDSERISTNSSSNINDIETNLNLYIAKEEAKNINPNYLLILSKIK